MGKCLGALVGCHLGGRPFVRSLGVGDRSFVIRLVCPYYLSGANYRSGGHAPHHICCCICSHRPDYSHRNVDSRRRVDSRCCDCGHRRDGIS